MCKADPDEELFTLHDHAHKIHHDELQEHLKYTIAKLKQELTAPGYVQELLQLRNPSKKDILDLYEKAYSEEIARALIFMCRPPKNGNRMNDVWV